MKSTRLIGMALPLIPLLFALPSSSQADDGDVFWHIDPGVETCSMVIDPSLTQGQWGKFTRQVSAIANFKSLASAEPLGRMNFTFGLDYSITPIDQRDPAWVNTFTHPDADCPLGDRIELPTIRARMGVSRTMDVGAFWTTAPGANYGLAGGEFKYAFMKESEKAPAAAVSASFAALTGVPNFNVNIYSVGFVTSKRIAMFTPYVGLRESLALGTETTSKVDLDREILALTQGFVGSTYSIWKVGVAAEYNIADVNTFALVLGYHR